MTELRRGIYEQLVTAGLEQHLRALDPAMVVRGPLDPADAHDVIARHLAFLARRALRSIGGDDAASVVRQVALANQIAELIQALAPDVTDHDDLVAETRDLLLAVLDATVGPAPGRPPARPEIPLAESALLVNGRDQPRIGTEVQRELASADRVDLLCAFVKWHGLRVLEEHIDALVRRGGQLRVITTTTSARPSAGRSTGWSSSERAFACHTRPA